MPAVKRTSIPAHRTNYYVGRRDVIKYIVIHTGETGEGSTPAEGMGNWFAQDHGRAGRSSAHVGADTDSICRYVADQNTAFGAPGVNASGFHIEHAGRAGQSASQWDDADSRLILANGALAAAEASKRLGVPARWLTDAQLRAGNVKGFITHAQASRVLGGNHWDPGPHFPADRYMALVRSHLGDAPTPTPDGDDDMPYTPAQIAQFVANGVAFAASHSPQFRKAIADLVWVDTQVTRDNKRVSALQELADAKTAARLAEAKADAVGKALASLPQVDAAALAADVAARVNAIKAADVAAELTITTKES